jgi:lysophospholipase L1-like esterase
MDRLLVFADSVGNAAGAGRVRDGFVCRLAARLEMRVLNRSQGGRTSEEARLLARELAWEVEPDLVVIAFGINDQKPVEWNRRHPLRHARPAAVDAGRYRENLIWLAEEFRCRAAAEPLLVAPPPIYPESNGPYRAAAIDAAQAAGTMLADPAAFWRQGLVAADGAHPNGEAHGLYADAIVEALGDHGISSAPVSQAVVAG